VHQSLGSNCYTQAVPRLIVNADDFGLTTGVNRAILELHSAGLLTSTTLMARAGASEEAIEIARATPSLDVGCHVVLVDGTPALPARQIRSLTHPSDNLFFPSLRSLLPRMTLGRVNSAEIEAETRAQIEFLLNRGVRLTHVDTHKHTHMFPAILRPVLRAARACGIHAIRNPFEPAWAVRATLSAAWLRTVQVGLLRRLEPACRRIIVEEGLTTTGGTVAVVGTGTLDAATLRSLLRQIPEGTDAVWELVTHPGYNDADLAQVRTRLRESRDVEREALRALKEFPAIQLISFGDL
jgi:chitin disaccharide deacetylase